MTYPFECDACKSTCDVIWTAKDYDNLPVPMCCTKKMNRVYCVPGFQFKATPGRDSGFYNVDYGPQATWDLRNPDKVYRLKKAGVLNDPFDAPNTNKRAARKANDDAMFGD